MCGIAGIVAAPSGTLDDARLRVRAMMRALAHRGPDGEGMWSDPRLPVVLGHTRLSVLELSVAGDQPMTSRSGRYVVNFNGEIYNFRQLRRDLESAGGAPRWRGHGDTEVLVAAIEAWGIERAIASIEGMFAIAICDCHEQELWLVRDRMGEKPLYYGSVQGTFAFASEPVALHAAFGPRLEIDHDVLPDYLRLGYIPAPYSMYRGIRKLRAGHALRLKLASAAGDVPASAAYWSLPPRRADEPLGEADLDHAADEVERVLRQSVAERMVSDVPVGAFLSGGVDSSLVVAMMARESATPVRTFTVGFDDPRLDESHHAREVAKLVPNVEHTELRVTAADALEVVRRLPRVFGEPFADTSQIPTYLLARHARAHITVALTGDGGDELFGGYERYFTAMRMWRVLAVLPPQLRGALSHAMEAVPVSTWDRLLKHLPRMAVGDVAVDGDRIHKLARMVPAADRAQLYSLLTDNWRRVEEALTAPPRSLPRDAPADDLDFCHEMMRTDMASLLPDGFLAKLDRTTMSVGLESRAPLLAESVVSLAWKLPAAVKMNRRQGKLVLRRVLSRYVPAELANRDKQGFQAPLDAWLRTGLRDWAEDLLDAQHLDAAGFRAGVVRKVWQEHLARERNWQFALWPVLMWQAFRREAQVLLPEHRFAAHAA